MKSWPWSAVLLLLLCGAAHLLLLSVNVSLTTGELKPRSLYIDENSILHKNVNRLQWPTLRRTTLSPESNPHSGTTKVFSSLCSHINVKLGFDSSSGWDCKEHLVPTKGNSGNFTIFDISQCVAGRLSPKPREETLLIFPYVSQVIFQLEELLQNLLSSKTLLAKKSKLVRILLIPVTLESGSIKNDDIRLYNSFVPNFKIVKNDTPFVLPPFPNICSEMKLRRSRALDWYLRTIFNTNSPKLELDTNFNTLRGLIRESYVFDLVSMVFQSECHRKFFSTTLKEACFNDAATYIEISSLADRGLQPNMDIISALVMPGVGNVASSERARIVTEGTLHYFNKLDVDFNEVKLRPFWYFIVEMAKNYLKFAYSLILNADSFATEEHARKHFQRLSNLFGFALQTMRGGSGLHTQFSTRNIDAVSLSLSIVPTSNICRDDGRTPNTTSNSIYLQSYVLTDDIASLVWQTIGSSIRLSENLHEELHHSQFYFIPLDSIFFVSFSEYLLSLFFLLLPILLTNLTRYEIRLPLNFRLKRPPNLINKIDDYRTVSNIADITLEGTLESDINATLSPIAILVVDIIFSCITTQIILLKIISVEPFDFSPESSIFSMFFFHISNFIKQSSIFPVYVLWSTFPYLFPSLLVNLVVSTSIELVFVFMLYRITSRFLFLKISPWNRSRLHLRYNPRNQNKLNGKVLSMFSNIEDSTLKVDMQNHYKQILGLTYLLKIDSSKSILRLYSFCWYLYIIANLYLVVLIYITFAWSIGNTLFIALYGTPLILASLALVDLLSSSFHVNVDASSCSVVEKSTSMNYLNASLIASDLGSSRHVSLCASTICAFCSCPIVLFLVAPSILFTYSNSSLDSNQFSFGTQTSYVIHNAYIFWYPFVRDLVEGHSSSILLFVFTSSFFSKVFMRLRDLFLSN